MQFNRVYEITVGEAGANGVRINSLRASFSISKTSTPNPNKCTVKVYNLSSESRALVESPNAVLILKAGYDDGTSSAEGAIVIFTGTVIRSLTTSQNGDFITEFELADGFLEFRDSKVSASFPIGTSGLTVLKHFASQLNVPVRQIPQFDDKAYPSGFSFSGRVRDGMNKVCKFLGLEWSIQNRELQIVAVGRTANKKAIYISSETGMIGSPSREEKTISDKLAHERGLANGQGVYKRESIGSNGKPKTTFDILGYKVKILLNPNAEPGGYAKLKSAGVDSFFRIESVDHVGDTHSNDWHSELTLRSING